MSQHGHLSCLLQVQRYLASKNLNFQDAILQGSSYRQLWGEKQNDDHVDDDVDSDNDNSCEHVLDLWCCARLFIIHHHVEALPQPHQVLCFHFTEGKTETQKVDQHHSGSKQQNKDSDLVYPDGSLEKANWVDSWRYRHVCSMASSGQCTWPFQSGWLHGFLVPQCPIVIHIVIISYSSPSFQIVASREHSCCVVSLYLQDTTKRRNS